MLRSLLLGVWTVLVLFVAAIPGWIALHRADLPEVDEGQLLVPRSQIPPEENGYEHFVEAVAQLDLPADADERICATREGGACDPAELGGLVARNAASLAALQRGVEAPSFQLPPHPRDGDDTERLDVLLGVQRLVKLAGAEARLLLDQGDPDAALARAQLGLWAGRRLAGAEGVDLVALMVATAVQGIGLSDLDRVVREIGVDRETARVLIARLEAARWKASDWQRAWASEYQFLRAALLEVEPGEADLGALDENGTVSWAWGIVPKDYLWQPNRTLSALGDVYREQQRRSALDCRAATVEDGEPDTFDTVTALLSPNPVGNLLVEVATPHFESFDHKRCHLETKISLSQAGIAAKAHWDEHGALPETLDVLVPEYLDALPRDRFGGSPLRYSSDRRVVYSAGEDFADAAGGGEPLPGNATEPALSLAF